MHVWLLLVFFLLLCAPILFDEHKRGEEKPMQEKYVGIDYVLQHLGFVCFVIC